jgi:hypothetical protein
MIITDGWRLATTAGAIPRVSAVGVMRSLLYPQRHLRARINVISKMAKGLRYACRTG